MMKTPTDFLVIHMSGYGFQDQLHITFPGIEVKLIYLFSLISKVGVLFLFLQEKALLPVAIVSVKYFRVEPYNDRCQWLQLWWTYSIRAYGTSRLLKYSRTWKSLSTSDFQECYIILASAFPSDFCDLRYQKGGFVSKDWGKEGTLLQLFPYPV